MFQNDLRSPSWPKLPKRVFWKFFEKIFFSPNVLKWYNSARKLKRFEEKNFTFTNCSGLDTWKIFGLLRFLIFGVFIGVLFLQLTFLVISKIWDHLPPRIFDALQLCINEQKRFSAFFMVKIAKKCCEKPLNFGVFGGVKILEPTFLEISKIWDHLTSRIFHAEQLSIYVQKRFEASFMVKIAKKGFLKIFWKNFFLPNVLKWHNSARKLKKI